MEEDSWVLIKKAFPGSKDHSLVVIPAEAGIQSRDMGELIRVGIPHGMVQQESLGYWVRKSLMFQHEGRNVGSMANQYRYAGFPLTACGNDEENGMMVGKPSMRQERRCDDLSTKCAIDPKRAAKQEAFVFTLKVS